MSECDGTIEHCPFRADIKAAIRETMLEEQRSIEPLRCAGHQELFREVTEARSDIRHMTDKLDEYVKRKEKEDAKRTADILDLKMHGAEISQQNAEDIIDIDGRLTDVEDRKKGECAVEHWYDSRLAQLGIICMIMLGLVGTAFEAYRFIKEVMP